MSFFLHTGRVDVKSGTPGAAHPRCQVAL